MKDSTILDRSKLFGFVPTSDSTSGDSCTVSKASSIKPATTMAGTAKAGDIKTGDIEVIEPLESQGV